MKTYTTKDKKLNKNNKGRLIIICLFWIGVWQIASMIIDNTLLLPSVFETIHALIALVQDQAFYMAVAWTLLRCVLSILLSFALGIVCAMGAYKNHTVRGLLTLPVSFFKAVPVMAIVIYVILLVEADWVAVVACFLMCFPIVYTNILAGLDATDKELLEVAKVYELPQKLIIKHIYFPGISPQIQAAAKIVAGLSWKAVVAAEVLSVPAFSLGQGMISAKYYLETPTLFAYIFVIVVLSLCLEKLIVTLAGKLNSKGYEGSKFKVHRLIDPDEKRYLRGASVKLVEVSKSFDDKVVLDKFNGDIKAGEKVAIMGPSGSGKTTLARIVAGLEKEDSGIVDFSTDLKMSYLFQEDRLFPWLNVYDNLALAMIGRETSLNDDLIVEMAKKLEIEDVLWSLPEELSGGMRHRVAIGRAFLAESNLMILDEPFRGLDQDLKVRIVDRLWEECTRDKSIVVITHNDNDLELLDIDKTLSITVE